MTLSQYYSSNLFELSVLRMDRCFISIYDFSLTSLCSHFEIVRFFFAYIFGHHLNLNLKVSLHYLFDNSEKNIDINSSMSSENKTELFLDRHFLAFKLQTF